MRTGHAGLALIKSCEGLRLKAYDDGTGVWTIGYGHVEGVQRGRTCTEAEADACLRADIGDAEAAVNALVERPLNQNQFDALVSFVFNVGAAAFRASTLLRRLNAGQYDSVPVDLAKWNHAGGKVMAGLSRRRAAEGKLWNAPAEPDPAVQENGPPSLEARIAALEAWRKSVDPRLPA